MKIFEYRGVEGLVYAEVLKDTAEEFQCGSVKPLAGVAEIAKSTDSANEAHYYDNLPAVVVSSTGSDTVTISASAIDYEVVAEITGQYYDDQLGLYVEKERTPKYFAIGYQTKTTDGDIMYVWRLKGTFNVPDEDSATENDGTDANGQELVYTGISTTHKFTKLANAGNNNKPKSAKALVVNTALGLADVSNFFESVQTPDTIQPASVFPSVTVSPSRAEVDEGANVVLSAVAVPAGTAISWTSSDTDKATVANGVVHGVAAGSVTITATITYDGNNYTDTCAVTVNEVEA